ncbi:HNH endonuclease [Pseudoalteromonas ruthenica]|uniref:HNH endonuclease n=1 Tax=Pseudoalteromonas ruthenica TaxID=151081 RepID=UPI00110A4152|nr:hypothetical protein [Pseudoalteromonas ruthenica]TMO85509.1 hypothetical protein CWC12_16700 [Pseudoalteromonas ruthenica]TMP22813.1 hypothetical protein CWC06_13475 [Pseudoalteromonas ruthenica]USN27134.1 hypothetical protein [synthetic construct]
MRRTATEKKNELKRLYNLKNGLAKRPTKGTDFPKWVANFHTVFDYNAMAKQFGYELSQLLDISVCPYCNQEDITTIHETDAEYRPAFDHFYPKSKFPFLATTLSNLIPAGERCNERYKAQSAMLSHENPYNKSISYEEPLFDFTTSAPSFYDKELQIKDVLVVVTDFNPDLTNNLELFKIEAVYNNKKFKNEFFKIRKCYNFLREQGNSGIDLNDLNSHNVDEIDHHFHVNLRVSPKTESMQKFKVDSLNKIAKSNFKMIK